MKVLGFMFILFQLAILLDGGLDLSVKAGASVLVGALAFGVFLLSKRGFGRGRSVGAVVVNNLVLLVLAPAALGFSTWLLTGGLK